jgi:hypothetical protein
MRSVVAGGWPSSFGCQIWGQAACEEACRVGPPLSGTIAKLGEDAAGFLAMVLQV